jgi:hypothetical protein
MYFGETVTTVICDHNNRIANHINKFYLAQKLSSDIHSMQNIQARKALISARFV